VEEVDLGVEFEDACNGGFGHPLIQTFTRRREPTENRTTV